MMKLDKHKCFQTQLRRKENNVWDLKLIINTKILLTLNIAIASSWRFYANFEHVLVSWIIIHLECVKTHFHAQLPPSSISIKVPFLYHLKTSDVFMGHKMRILA